MFLALLLLSAPIAVTSPTHTTAHEQTKSTISGDQLKSWYDQNKEMIVLDARSEKYFDGTMLPDAQWLPYDSSEEVIAETLPNKEAVIVVYCAGPKCPASGWLYDKLHSMGYTSVYEYHEGLREWMQKGYPTTEKS
jgi:rhodanese-related sulfurtransferase